VENSAALSFVDPQIVLARDWNRFAPAAAR
jgi:hypothetical protein